MTIEEDILRFVNTIIVSLYSINLFVCLKYYRLYSEFDYCVLNSIKIESFISHLPFISKITTILQITHHRRKGQLSDAEALDLDIITQSSDISLSTSASDHHTSHHHINTTTIPTTTTPSPFIEHNQNRNSKKSNEMIKLFSFNHFYGSIPKDDANISNDYDKDSQDENDTFELSIFHHNDHDVNSHSHANIISKKRSMSSDVSVVRTITIPITDSNDTCMSENDVSIIANTMNALLGVSIFAMPWGYLKSGVFGGSILVLIVGALSFETARVLLVAQKVLYDRTGDFICSPSCVSNI